MALTKLQIMDLLAEERQILITKEKAEAARKAAKDAAEQAYLAALNQADADYVTVTQAAESRLLDLRRQLELEGAWEAPTVL